MFRARERGMSYWPFVVTLVALLFMSYMWYEASKNQENDRSAVVRLTTEKQSADEALRAMKVRFQEVGAVTGFANDRDEPDPELLKQGIADLMNGLRTSVVLKFPTDKFSATAGGGKLEKIGQGDYQVHYLPPANEIPTDLKWDSIAPLLTTAAKAMAVDMAHQVAVKAAAEQARDEAATASAATISAKDEMIADLTRQIQAIQASKEEQGSELRETIATLESQLDTARGETEEIRGKWETVVADAANAEGQLKGEITRLVDREKPFISEGPDGEVLAAGEGIVIVNRGKGDMLMPGTVFTVWKRVKGGGLVQTGTIKATVVDDNTARCAVLEASDVISEGDLIQSGTYSPNRQLHFVLLGEFRKMGKSQATARLEQLGAKVDDSVSTMTHYLVVGTGDALEGSATFLAAKTYGTAIITEAQLASFTRY